jgi:hypothetical protein
MSPQPTLYSVQPSPTAGTLSVEQVWSQDGSSPLATDYRRLFPVTVGGAPHLIGVNGANEASAFRFEGSEPWIAPVESHLDIGGPWDVIEPFVIGNIPHLMAYTSGEGVFAFIPLTEDLSTKPSYRYSRRHDPGLTTGFDVAHPIAIDGAVYYLCYSFDGGQVYIYSLAVTASAPSGQAPLVSNPVWLHQWARRWTRFAFFELGGETFFLKTNVGRLNVNIDHVCDNPADGTVEVGTYLDLEDALALDIVRPFYLGAGNPYFLTYMKDGKTTLNRFHGDCQGWATEARLTTVSDASQIVPIQLGEACYLLFC